jgi:hypothetical protein
MIKRCAVASVEWKLVNGSSATGVNSICTDVFILSTRESGLLSRYSDGLRAARTCLTRHGQEIILFSTTIRLALGLTQPPIQWLMRGLSPGRKTDHSSPSSVDIKNDGAIPRFPICLLVFDALID